MRRLGITVEREMDHPRVPEGSPLRRHVRDAASRHDNQQLTTARSWPRPGAASTSFSIEVASCPPVRSPSGS